MKHRLPIAAALCFLAGCSEDIPDLEQVRERGYIEFERGHLDSASAIADDGYRRAVKAGARAAAWSLDVLKAEVLLARRDMKSALVLLAKPAPPGVQPEARVRWLMTRAFVLCELGRHQDASQRGRGPDDLLATAAAIANEISSTRLIAEVALRHGTCAIAREDYEQAERSFRRALTLARGAGLRHLEGQAADSLALVRLQTSRYDDAADWLRLALGTSPTDMDKSKMLGNLGWSYTVLGDAEKALPPLQESAEIAGRLGLTEDAAYALYNLGLVHFQLRDLRSARPNLLRSLALMRKLGQRDDLREVLDLLQTVEIQAGNSAGAEAHAREEASLVADHDSGRAPPPTLVEAQLLAQRGQLDQARATYERVGASTGQAEQKWRAFAGIASVEVARGRPQAAEDAFRQASSAIEAMRAELEQDTFEFLLFSSLVEFYGRYAAFLVDRGRGAEALALVDRSRGRVLWEHLGSGAPERAPDRFEPAARAAHAVLLSYWLGERSFLWVVTADSTEVHELPPAAELRAMVESYQAQVQRSRDPLRAGLRDATELYRILVQPAASHIPRGSRVIIVPDGALHQLSFDTLVVPSPAPHYWIEDVVTMRAPSLGLLTAPRPSAAPPDRELLAIGDPVQPSAQYPALPNAGREMAEVASHFPPEKTLVVTGSEATPTAYGEADPSRFEYIHFAAHATSQSEQPLDSAVVLSEKDLNYKLYAHDIVRTPIHAELVSLSACRGAGARAYRGEGLVGFAWAFLRAGARHVVAGLWNVEDASTAHIMSGLYARLAAGTPPAEALRQARLELLHSTGAYRKPFYWGPFVIYVQQQG
ncbi:MAG TPA: CHAT domain-containing protein [Kofleriaceae bacterium]|nr:CHAT domain-containing protein [Kofleriaceae bacterium]